MYFVLTTAGEAAIAASPGTPPTITLFRLGGQYGYVPAIGDTDIRGVQVYSGTPSAPVPQSTSIVKYTITLDSSVGDFSFGEVGLYLPGGVLFALGCMNLPVNKLRRQGTQPGNDLAIDCYVSTVGSNYAIFAEIGNSASNLNLGAVNSVDTLPSAFKAHPNVFIVPSPDGKGSLVAFSNNAAWSFTGYEEIADEQLAVNVTPNTISFSDPSTAPIFDGELLLQVVDGDAMGAVRIITGYTSVGHVFTVGTPFLISPSPGDTIRILKKTQLRDNVATLLAGLDVDLTSGHLNDLLNNPLSGMVKRNGTTPMLAPFDAGSHRMINVAAPVNSSDAVNKDYVDQSLGTNAGVLASLLAQVAVISSMYVRRDGTVAMTGNFNFGAHRGVNLATPINPSDAATKAWTEGAIQTALAGVPDTHNDLLGLQGGDGISQYYHLTSAEKDLIASLASQGLPVASYILPGITRYATPVETGNGALSTAAVTPESLLISVSSPSTNALQNALLDLVTAGASPVQFGSGDPNVGTPVSPPFYADIADGAPVLWVRRTGIWQKLSGYLFRIGSLAPDANTPVSPPVYFETGTDPWNFHIYSSGSWRRIHTPYVQHGLGAPTGITPTNPSVYLDASTSPYTMYSYYGGAWHQVSATTDGTTAAELYFMANFGR